MIRHYCDCCGAEVDGENGAIGMKELTVEMADNAKVSIAIEVSAMKNGNEAAHPAVCAACIAKRTMQWAASGELKSVILGQNSPTG